MLSCEELAAQIAELQAALVVDAAAIQAAQNVQTAHQMALWYAQYNFMLQGCGGSGMMAAGGGLTVVADQMPKSMPVRTPSEMLVIMAIPDLFALHKKCEAAQTGKAA